MSSHPSVYLSPEEYLAQDRRAEQKSEYFDGEVFLMAGASRSHNLIVSNVNRELGTQLKNRPCEVYPSDMRVRIPLTPRYFFPDVSVVCGKPQFEDDHHDVLLNPVIVVEVLSSSTEAFDRGRKYDSYRRIPSLQEIVLISQDECRVLLTTRQPDGKWLLSELSDPASVLQLSSTECSLPLTEIYSKVES
jgi:Uma2 family endonuclease